MPLYQVDIEKSVLSEFFTNVYYVFAPTLSDAITDSAAIVAFERAISSDNVAFLRQRVRTAAQGDEVYSILPLTGAGSRELPTGILPLFNTLNVILGAVVGRPSRKYYRGVLSEGDIVFNQVSGTLLAFVTTQANVMLTAFAGAPSDLVDIDGTGIFSVLPVAQVGMRQLRRGSKRRTQPILT